MRLAVGSATMDAVGQAELVRTGAASPVELVDEAIGRIERINPQLNAVVRDRFERARAEATGALPDGPFRGVPLLLKDLSAGIEGEALLLGIRDVAVSSGSACTSASLLPSHVLKAVGVPDDLAHASIRFGLGRFTTAEQIDFAVRAIVAAVHRLRELSPLVPASSPSAGS